jgi:hypothetical protein
VGLLARFHTAAAAPENVMNSRRSMCTTPFAMRAA